MKLTCLFVAMGCTGMQLLMANSGKSQELNEVRVSLELKNEPLRAAFTRIEQQTDFRFAYNRQLIDNSGSVTISRGSYTVEKALELMLANTRLLYRRVSNKIIVYRADDSTAGRTPVEMKALVAAQTGGTIKGVVTNDKGEPMVGASIILSGQAKGTPAGLKGEFTIDGVKPGKYTLQISAVGYQTVLRDVTVSNGQVVELDIQLKSGGNPMSEVIVTGYSRQSKHDVTGAASTISADQVAQTPAADITGELQGRVAGVTVDGQGGPGAPQVVRIRGIGTLGDNDPLYVVDGVQIRMGPNTTNGSQNISNLINPNDIESITILKDPSLTSLYGAEGSNGVIVITTKSGKLGAPRLEYNGYIGENAPRHLPKDITPQQQADAYFQSFANSTPVMTPPTPNLFGTGTAPVLPYYIIEQTGQDNTGVQAGDPAANAALYNLDNYRILKANQSGTDWWRTIFRPAITENHQLALSGATDKSNYAVTLGYMNDQGTMLNSYFIRYSLRVNTQFKIRPWLRVGENMEMSFTSQNTVGRGFNNDLASLYEISPLMPTHDIMGNFAGTKDATFLGNQVGSPLTDRSLSKNAHGYNQSMIGTAYIEAEPIKGLTYTNQIGFEFIPTEYHYYVDTVPQDPGGATVNMFSEGGGYTTDWRWLNKLAYTTTVAGVHKITAFVAYEAHEFATRSYSGLTGDLPYTGSNSLYLNEGNPNVFTSQLGGGGDKQTDASYLGNIAYSLMDRYLMTVSGRRDGSSKFGPNDYYANFGAVSAGWRISQEKFMDKVTWINDLKLRASYGASGNNAIPSGLYQSLYSVNAFGYYDLAGTNTSSMVGAFLSQFGNPGQHWETNYMTNIGFDAAAFSNHLTASFNWFDRLDKGLLYEPPAPGTAGAALAPWENIMTFDNKGVELELGYNNKVGKLRYEMSFNIATYRNKVKYIDGIDSTFIAGGAYGSGGGTFLTRSIVGKPVSSFYGYVSQGFFQSAQDVAGHADESATFGITQANGAGHFKYRDLNNHGVIDPNDETYIGNPNPKFTYGYTLNLYYGNFDFGVTLQGVYGNKIFNYFKAVSLFPNGAISGQGGVIQGSLDTWTPSNTNAKLPIYSQNTGVNDLSPSSYFVESGSYMRVKMAQLGYTFPKNKAFDRLRIYVQGYNLFTFTHYSGIDPEVNDGNPNNIGVDYGTAFPISMKLLFGVQLGL
jgi:TonB-linked SusC/RagA family outer membrane protein